MSTLITTSPSAAISARPSWISDSAVMIRRCLHRSYRDPEAFITALMLPVILMLLFVYVFGGALRTGGAYIDYVVPGLIVLCTGFGAGNTAVQVASDMTNGIVDRLRSMPIHGAALLVGQITASLARNLLATTAVIAVAIGIGWRPTASPLRWLAAAAMIVLFLLALSWFAATIGLLVGSVEAASGATFFLMFLPYASSAFVPTHTLPGPLRAFAEHQPFTPIVETMRGLWMGHTAAGGSLGHQALLAIAYCVAILVASGVAASWLFQRRRTG